MLGVLLVTIAIAIIVDYGLTHRKKKNIAVFLNQQIDPNKDNDKEAIKLDGIKQSKIVISIQNYVAFILDMIGQRAYLKLSLLLCGVTAVSYYVITQYLSVNPVIYVPLCNVLAIVFLFRILASRRKNLFEQTFPDALNTLVSAISAGENIEKSFAYVGASSSGNLIADEFREISERMKLGESIDTIFNRSSQRFPYPTFIFFVVAIRANRTHGGQLRTVLERLVRVLVESRNIDRKAKAMTSEARTSAKIVGAIPFGFLFIMKFISPDNFDYVIFNPQGQWILYYLLASVGFGMLIIWGLVKGIR